MSEPLLSELIERPWFSSARTAAGPRSKVEIDSVGAVSPMVIHCMDVKPGVEVACLTDVGRQRENNEDSCLYWEPQDEAEFRRKGRLAVIADGMGGYEGGQEASR